MYPTSCNITQIIYIWKLLYMFRVVIPPIIRSAYNFIYSIWYLSHRYCYLPLSWKSWNWFQCAVGGLRKDNSRNESIIMTSSVVLVEEKITFVSKNFSKTNFYIDLNTDSVSFTILIYH
jgi:hypothetical protein